MSASDEFSFAVEYCAKDVILYALSIGFSMDDLCFVHENDPNFSVAPTFALALMFHASLDEGDETRSYIPEFPPPMMRYMGLIPKSSLVDPACVPEDFPALHTFQSITWHQTLPVPPKHSFRRSSLRCRCLAVQPKRVGTFVTTETKLFTLTLPSKRGRHLLCTILSTTLLLGLDASSVRKFGTMNAAKPGFDRSVLVIDTSETIHENTALLFRIASGDTNRIHVDASPFGKPIIHGLCALGIVSRLLLRKYKGKLLTHLEGSFVKPIFLGSVVRICVWSAQEGSNDVSFEVSDKNSGEMKISHGRAIVECSSPSKL